MKHNYAFFTSFGFVKYFCVLLFCFQFTFSQQNNLLLKAKELVYANPDEAIKISKHVIKTEENIQEIVKANILLANSYWVKSDYKNVIVYLYKKENHFEEIPVHLQAEVYTLKARIMRELYLDKQANENILNAESKIKLITNQPIQDSLKTLVALEKIYMQLERQEPKKALQAIKNLQINNSKLLNSKINISSKIFLAKEQAYQHLGKQDSAKYYLDKVLQAVNRQASVNIKEKAFVYKELGHLQLQEKKFSTSEESLFIALSLAEIIDNKPLLLQINKDLAIGYLAQNKTNQNKVYNDKFLVLNTQVEQIEQNALNTLFNIATEQNELNLTEQKQEQNKFFNIALSIGLIILCVALFFLFKVIGKKKRLQEIIKYIQISKTNLVKTKPVKKTKQKRIHIPIETEKVLLDKLKKFENSKKFLSKDMSLAVLAGSFETNTKYLSEIINKHYHDNFNTFINKLRINYIINKLKTDSNYINYKISFLAEDSGYASHSSFATVFKSIVGMSPVTFINLIKEEREQKLQKQEA